MKRIVIGLVFAALMSCQAMAQSSVRIQAQAVATCGAQTLTAGTFYPVDQDLTGTLCVSSSGGGGGGLSVTDQATWTNAVSAFTPTGGVFNDSATALASGKQGTVRLNANREMHVTCDIGNVLCGLINGPTPAGGNIIGKVGIDQTTPGTTNGVAIVGVNGATALAGNGVTGTGSVRVTVSSDNSAIPLWGHGSVAAGTAATSSVLAGATFNTTAPTLTNGQQAAVQVSNRGGLLLGNGYPAGSTPITISATGTTAATTATLATGASVTTYICGFSIRANATAVATNNATVTGTITGTLNYTQWTAPLASGLGVTEQIFTPCIPASAVNTGIAVISGAPGSGGVVSVTAWGFTL